MLYIASQLTYLAFLANFGSIVTVLLCFIAMVLFIRRFRLYEFDSSLSSVTRVRNIKAEQYFTKVTLPFSIKLHKTQIINDELNQQQINFYSNSSFPCFLFVFCDMSAETVKSLINSPWPQLNEIVTSEISTKMSCLLSADELHHENKEFSVRIPLRAIPRSSYAAVIFQLRKDEDYSNQDPVGLVTLVHVPDQFCSSPVTIVGQYLKCADNRVLNLKPVYSPERAISINDEGDEDIRRGNADCVICWNLPASHVLLPCRHACLCSNCFKRVENCPVCRTRILSYFVA